MNTSLPLLADISNPALTQALQYKLDQKTKPQGSLGQLESLGLKLGQILGTESPALAQPQLVVFTGDHGLAARGVSAYPSDVTWHAGSPPHAQRSAAAAGESVRVRKRDGTRHLPAPELERAAGVSPADRKSVV